MKMHELKTVNPWFTDMWNGDKDFEIRKDDRDYEKGDLVWSREYVPNTMHDKENDCLVITGDDPYTGRSIIGHIKYILPAGVFEGLSPGYCALGVTILQKREDNK
jgi:hypothetical protein